jgi:hypothetical protein
MGYKKFKARKKSFQKEVVMVGAGSKTRPLFSGELKQWPGAGILI